MDPAELLPALQATCSPIDDVRNNAEKYLASNTKTPGFFPALLSIVASDTSSKALKQAAAIALKNRLRFHYHCDNESDRIISEGDKAVLRQNIINVICSQEDESIVKIIGFLIREVTKYDFPDNWPEFVPQVESNINSQNPAIICNALFIIKEIFVEFQYDEEKRPLCVQMFTYFYNVFVSLLNTYVQQNDGYKICHMILKLYDKYIFGLCRYDGDKGINFDQVTQWVQLLTTVLVHDAPVIPEGTTNDELKTLPWWNSKKRAMKIINQLQMHLGRKTSDKEDNVDDSEKVTRHPNVTMKFVHTLSPVLLDIVLKQLELFNAGQQFSEPYLVALVNFLTEIVDVSSLYKLLKTKLNFLFLELAPKLLALTPSELELYTEEPTEFVTKYYGANEIYEEETVRGEISTFISHIARVRAGHVLKDFINYLVELLNKYNASAPEQRNFIEKEWVLYVLGLLSNNLLSKSVYKGNLEILLNKHVYPEFNSPNGILRARACFTYRDYSDLNLNPEHFNHVLEKVLGCLRDPDFPVQIAAATTLRDFLEKDECQELIRPHVGSILREFLNIMNKLGVEDVIDSMNGIVEQFEEEIVPFCGKLAQQLMITFEGYIKDKENDDEALYSAANCLEVVSTLCSYIDKHKEIYNSLIQILFPYMQTLLNPQYIEILDSVISIITSFLLYTDNYSSELYSLYPIIINYLTVGATDYVADAFTIFDCYISNDPKMFVSLTFNGMSYVDMTFEFIHKCLDELGPSEMCYLYMIETCLLHNCLSLYPALLEKSITASFKDLEQNMKELASYKHLQQTGEVDEYLEYDIEDTELVITRILINIESCVGAFPIPSLQIISNILPIDQFMSILLENYPKHESIVERTTLFLCISSLMALDPASQPAIAAVMDKCVYICVDLLSKISEEQAKQGNKSDDDEVDFDAISKKLNAQNFEQDNWGYDEENDVNEGDDDLLAQLDEKEIAALLDANDNSIKKLDEDFASPVMNTNLLSHFKTTVDSAMGYNPGQYQAYVNNLPQIAKDAFQNYYTQASSSQ
ncbi:hypothetical protein WA158_005508 [Blastocystis sp. Blastoise]